MAKTGRPKGLGRTGVLTRGVGLGCVLGFALGCVLGWGGLLSGRVARADTPLWQLGLPTFGGKNPEAKAQQGPSFSFPPPEAEIAAGAEIAALPDTATGAATAPTEASLSDVQPAAYQSGPGETATVSYPGLPMPPLPATSELAFPVAPPTNSPLMNPPAVTTLPSPPESVPAPAPSTPIGQAIASGEAVEPAPLAEETESWYQIPWRWVTRGWENHAELGLDGSSGNSRTLALQTGLEMKRKTDRYTLGIDFDYRKATNRGITTEDNGRLNLDYDRLFEDSRWSAFGKFGAEWDQFKAFDSRLNLNGGLGYHFVRTDDALLATKFGAGASKEIGAPDDAWKPEAVFGAEAEYQLNRYNKMKAKVDYFPAWEDFSDYRLVSDVAWEILLDDTDNLSLKLALTDRYDSTPQGAKPNDVYYSLLLLVKF
ncbi:DUF481 domain-containing protein [Stieleria mannarensis]|uniref:DUF481 domain-containing protein n=1 Tax=Stieleria mannarensis TaxID=2755585 RepID=UPI00257026A3|nr:DUF481 domain-containing protein [Rhodopirellula sp. JC639]